MTKLLYLETAYMDKYTSTDYLHKLRSFFTSNFYFSYIICQKMIKNGIEEDIVIDTDEKQKDRRQEFLNAIARHLKG
jgi:hypothetical protein